MDVEESSDDSDSESDEKGVLHLLLVLWTWWPCLKASLVGCDLFFILMEDFVSTVYRNS